MATTAAGDRRGILVVAVVEGGVAGAHGLVDHGERPGDAEVVVHRLAEASGSASSPVRHRGGDARAGRARRKPSMRSTAGSASSSEPGWYSIIER